MALHSNFNPISAAFCKHACAKLIDFFNSRLLFPRICLLSEATVYNGVIICHVHRLNTEIDRFLLKMNNKTVLLVSNWLVNTSSIFLIGPVVPTRSHDLHHYDPNYICHGLRFIATFFTLRTRHIIITGGS